MHAHATVIGRLTRDPEGRDAGSSRVVKIGLASNMKYGDSERTLFIDCKCWGKLGATVEQHMRKGERVVASGRLETESWESNGNKQSRIVMVADSVRFLDPKGDKQSQQQREEPGDDDLPF